ncbi:hypothetical protein ACO2Q1_16265 [Brevundimonas sp. VNH65]|uniref:hypothetical protein n=1 Tax=Brevundimonas sp. VNH65 TaxID=3400917 RepID=UPI003C0F213B
MRRGVFIAAMLAASAFSASVAVAQATPRGNALAYEAALKCFVANGHASGLRARAGEPQRAAAYDLSARQSFDAATRLGQLLGYSNQRISQDFGLVQSRELPAMVADAAYFRQTVATCRALGLMPRD